MDHPPHHPTLILPALPRTGTSAAGRPGTGNGVAEDEGAPPGPDLSELGTFRESKQAPIHGWFQYPAGFSYRAVDWVLDLHRVRPGDRVLDPFTGTGTTQVVCKGRGVPSAGTESHPFVARIAQTKVFWDFDYPALRASAERFQSHLRSSRDEARHESLEGTPDLLLKCFSPSNLQGLLYVKREIRCQVPPPFQALFEVALIGALRRSSGAATGWPYIAPRKRIEERDGIDTFRSQLDRCVRDLCATPPQFRRTPSEVVEGDCRKSPFEDASFTLAFTSPPYLNNYDYADRTRLEGYFMDFVRSWGEISERVRGRLIMSATTQALRSRYRISDIVDPALWKAAPAVAGEIQRKVDELTRRRLERGGRKSYDVLVGQYFNDLARSLSETARLLRPGSRYILILGDSAPYGVHVPTEEYLGQIACGLGFQRYRVVPLRGRGGKWRANPQRHQVPLRESLLILDR
jgi:DNA modification methylase